LILVMKVLRSISCFLLIYETFGTIIGYFTISADTKPEMMGLPLH